MASQTKLPGYLQLELSRQVLHYIAYLGLRAHTLRVKTGCWRIHDRLCDKCDFLMSRMKSLSFFMPLLRNVLFEKEICRTIC